MNNTISYVLVNNLGGITTFLQNIIAYGHNPSVQQEAIVLNIKENRSASISGEFFKEIETSYFSFSNKENWYCVMQKLSRLAGKKSGLLVVNDVYEMLMLTHYNISKKVVQIVHDGYNVRLAIFYGDVVDAFICHSEFFYDVMTQLFPLRRNKIFLIPYGVPISKERPKLLEENNKIKLVFLGRHDTEKGVLDLLQIEKYLQLASVPTDWLILGNGPLSNKVKDQWRDKPNVKFITPETNAEVISHLKTRDILVFPTRFEGFPVALVESMSVGCVPVASNLPGGLREVVTEGQNGFLCDFLHLGQFAEKIEWLHLNRDRLEQMSLNGSLLIAEKFNVVYQSPKYHALFENMLASGGVPVHHSVRKKLGSRLDQPWIPNFLTKFLRQTYP